MAHGTQIPCNFKFPLTIKIQGDTWKGITPNLVSVAPPLVSTLDQDNTISHVNKAIGGAYTAAEANAWEQELAFPHYHTKLPKELSLGVCLTSGTCDTGTANNGIPRYDLTGITLPLESLNLVQQIDDWIRRNGDYLAVVCLLIFFIKAVVNLSMLAAAWIQNGPATVVAVLLETCCRTHHQFQKMKWKQRRLKERETVAEARAEVPLNELPTAPAVTMQQPFRIIGSPKSIFNAY